MKYRRFGRTEIQMPVFSCGGMRYQQHWQDEDWEKIDKANQENLENTILRSLEVGINHIETARGYGSSERQLGKILPTLPREKMIIQTKVVPSDGNKFVEEFNTCMDRLRLDYVDLLSVHGINTSELLALTLEKGGPLEQIRKFQAEGRVRHVGFSTHGPCSVISEAAATGEFDYVNLHWYWINQSNWPAILKARENDMGVFIISPNDKGGKLYAPTPKLTELCAPLSPMAFNDLFCLLRDEVHTLSLGASKPSDFDEHIKALESLDNAPQLVDGIQARLIASMKETLGADWVERWEEGIPEWDKIPGGVNVWEIVRLWNYAVAFDMIDFGKMRYNLLGNADHWFPGENASQTQAAEILRSVSASPFAERIPGILAIAHALLSDRPVQRLSKSD